MPGNSPAFWIIQFPKSWKLWILASHRYVYYHHLVCILLMEDKIPDIINSQFVKLQ